jgi:death-on-curing protein
MREPIFLTLAEIIEIHADQIMRYGGGEGIRDIALLSSAVAMPYATISDQYLHDDLFLMAAAYAFHISQDHPFIDGNKRTALASALVFLELNGYSFSDPQGLLYDAMINVAVGKLDKSEFAKVLRKLSE